MNPEQLETAITLQRQGKTQQQIAAALGVCQGTVSRGLGAFNRRVAKRLARRAVERKAKQVEQLESLFSDVVSEWHRSKLDAESIRTTDGTATVPARTETTVKGQTGNPALLAQARGLLADVRDILGLDAPKTADITSDGKPLGGPSAFSRMTTDDLLALRNILGRAADPRPGAGPG